MSGRSERRGGTRMSRDAGCRRSRSTPRRRTLRLWPHILGAQSFLALAVLTGCSGNPPLTDDLDADDRVDHVELALADYHRMGFLTGTPDFPVVGRVVVFRGPADSAYVALTASMSPSALRFAREGSLFAGSYQVLLAVTSGPDTVLRMNRREVVRVEDFTETASQDELIFFQRFVTLPTGSYDLAFTLRELTTRDEATRTFHVEVPPFGGPGGNISTPILALRALPRQAYAQYPPLIIAPRSTAAASRQPPFLVVEIYDEVSDTLSLKVSQDGELMWQQVLEPQVATGPDPGPRTVLTTLPIAHIPPGLAELTVATEDGVQTRAPLLLALDVEWAFAEWEKVVEHLVYAMSSDSLERWKDATVAQRAELWSTFWRETDLDPETPRNEFLGRYFDRMTEAEARFPEPGIPGWRTHRGRAHVQLGQPDHVLLRGGGQTGEPRRIEWIYDESVPFRILLRFVDQSEFGVFRLDSGSRLVLRDAFQRLRELERSGEWVDERDNRHEDVEGS
jgi:GWxTD domain-containing protein